MINVINVKRMISATLEVFIGAIARTFYRSYSSEPVMVMVVNMTISATLEVFTGAIAVNFLQEL